MLEDFYELTDLPITVTSLNQSDSTAHRLCWLIQHDAPLQINNEDTKPILTRTYSNYGYEQKEYDPMWQHEQIILESFFKKWDVSRLQLAQALKQFHNQKPSFCKLIQYLIGASQYNIAACFQHRNIISKWFQNGVKEFYEPIPDLIFIFELTCQFFKDGPNSNIM